MVFNGEWVFAPTQYRTDLRLARIPTGSIIRALNLFRPARD
jgi:hypothetical protein